MNRFSRFLTIAARYGRVLLVAGLLAGILWEEAASWLQPFVGELAVLMIFLSAFRIGWRQAVGVAGEGSRSVLVIAIYQFGLPLVAILVLSVLGVQGNLLTAIVLVTAGASISGAPNLAILVGSDPAPALRLLVVGTALLPLTIFPIVWLYAPLQGEVFDLAPVFYLAAIIAFTTLAAFLSRHAFVKHFGEFETKPVDGLLAIVMMIIVIGLMAAVGPAIFEAPRALAGALAAAFAINFGLQILSYLILGEQVRREERIAWSIVAGNRNIALFLAVFPAAVIEPLLLFIGCYQIPMYLTPILLRGMYKTG